MCFKYIYIYIGGLVGLVEYIIILILAWPSINLHPLQLVVIELLYASVATLPSRVVAVCRLLPYLEGSHAILAEGGALVPIPMVCSDVKVPMH